MNLEELKAQIEQFSTELKQSVEDGFTSPIKGFGLLTEAIEQLSQCKNEIKDIAMAEAEKYGESQFEAEGYAIRVTQGRRLWDFKECPSWAEINEKQKSIEKQLKLAYELYEKNPSKTVVDEDGVIELPKCKFSESSISVKPCKVRG